jgi:serine protease Do
MNSRTNKIGILAIINLVLFASAAWAQQPDRLPNRKLRDGADVRQAYVSVVASADRATVRILCGGKEADLGTVVDSDGWILTKYSELRDPVSVRLSDRKLPAKIVGYDPHSDLAMLKIEADNLTPVQWTEEASGPRVGQLVATASPGDLPRALGVVSLPRHSVPPPGGVLGIELEQFGGSAKIKTILPHSPAQQAGLQVDDVVTRLADKPIDSGDALVEALQWHKPGDSISLGINRGDHEMQFSVTLTTPKHHQNRSDEMNAASGGMSRRAVDFPNVIQHDSALRPEDCGGPLVDLSGKALGINIARAGRIASYAIPADQILPILDNLKNGKLAPPHPLPKTS